MTIEVHPDRSTTSETRRNLRQVLCLGAGDPTRAKPAEARLSAFWQQHGESGLSLSVLVARHPRLAAQAAAAVLQLPQLEAVLTDSPGGRLLREYLCRRIMRWPTVAGSGACLLDIPREPGQYQQGPHRQTLRRKIRAAQKQGVSARSVTSPAEQLELASELTRVVRAKADDRYRQDHDWSFLVGLGPWTVAYAEDGTPLVVAVTPQDGQWALLRCFIALGDSVQHSNARYLLTDAVVERLRADGVRYLVDTRAPVELTSGLRHFQRMLGFRIARIRVRRPLAAA